jgi:hypothetical protein
MFKKVSLVNLRKLIKNEGFKKDPELKGYSYKKKKVLLEVLEKKNISEETINKYRTKKKSKVVPKEEPKKQTKAKPEYIIKHFLKGGKMKTDRIYHNKELAIKYFDKVVNKSHDKCVLFMKKPGKMRIIKMSKHKNKDYSKTYEKAKTLFKKKY